jgi:AmmeMemoRadiSam system protein A
VEASVRGAPLPELPSLAELGRPAGVFVTLHRRGELRGCLGHLEADVPLASMARRMAVASAHDDPRFPPVSREELGDLDVEVSVLTPLREASAGEIVPGKHGVVVRRGHRQGVLLPQVATEQRWDRERFLAAACRKAGLPEGAWGDPATDLWSFEVQVIGAAALR